MKKIYILYTNLEKWTSNGHSLYSVKLLTNNEPIETLENRYITITLDIYTDFDFNGNTQTKFSNGFETQCLNTVMPLDEVKEIVIQFKVIDPYNIHNQKRSLSLSAEQLNQLPISTETNNVNILEAIRDTTSDPELQTFISSFLDNLNSEFTFHITR